MVVSVPDGLELGQVIGKAGSNVKYLQNKSKTRMFVDCDARVVTVKGHARDVSTALDLLEKQFANWRSSGKLSQTCMPCTASRIACRWRSYDRHHKAAAHADPVAATICGMLVLQASSKLAVSTICAIAALRVRSSMCRAS